jgi:hypothetical protein
MKRIIKKTICLILIILLCIPFVGCTKRITAQTEYHDRIAGLEQYVLESMGDYIKFNEPQIIETEDAKYLYIQACFLTDYLENQEVKSLDQVVNETRMRINEYMTDNPDFFLNDDYEIVVDFVILNDIMFSSANPVKSTVATVSNRTGITERNNRVFYEYLYTLALEDEDLEYIETISDVKMIFLKKSNTTQILDVVDHCPNIERVVVYTSEMAKN